MTLLQRIYKTIYPLTKSIIPKKTIIKDRDIITGESFYDLDAIVNDGRWFDFSNLKDKAVLIVNTASNCVFTPQYEELQQLYKLYSDKITVLAFPSNDFLKQEPATDNAIRSFCFENYGITFPIMRKSVILKKEQQHIVFQWLTNKKKNGWNEKAPQWNFTKYVINERGILTHCFSSATSPLSDEIKNALGLPPK